MVILTVTTFLHINTKDKASSIINSPKELKVNLSYSNSAFIPQPIIQEKLEQYRLQQIDKINQDNFNKDKQSKIDSIERLFAKYKSPMKGLGELIYNRANECGGDYKTIVAIAGNESGFGSIPYKKYNPFGYLDGVQYSGWYDAVYKITCSISKRFIIPCKNDLNCIVKRYGGSNTNREKWVKNITFYKNLLK